MKYRCYDTMAFLDSFEVNCSEGKRNYDNFHDQIDERLVVFEANHKDYSSLLEFAYACIYEQYEKEKRFVEAAYMRVPCVNPPYTPWEYYKNKFIEYPITKESFDRKLNFCVKGLRKKIEKRYSDDSISTMILKDEWDSVFIVAEYIDIYVGYWWKANF